MCPGVGLLDHMEMLCACQGGGEVGEGQTGGWGLADAKYCI